MIELRVTKPPFSDKRVRYALNQAIDKDAIIKNIMRGQALPLKTPGIEGVFTVPRSFDRCPMIRRKPNRCSPRQGSRMASI